MRLDNVFRIFAPLPTIIILALALPFLIIGLLSILGFGGWSVWRYARAEREFQAARRARLR
jgi:hypothetical protein